jgi:hypothetical protein
MPMSVFEVAPGLTVNGTQFVTRSVSEGLLLFIFTGNSLVDASG